MERTLEAAGVYKYIFRSFIRIEPGLLASALIREFATSHCLGELRAHSQGMCQQAIMAASLLARDSVDATMRSARVPADNLAVCKQYNHLHGKSCGETRVFNEKLLARRLLLFLGSDPATEENL